MTKYQKVYNRLFNKYIDRKNFKNRNHKNRVFKIMVRAKNLSPFFSNALIRPYVFKEV